MDELLTVQDCATMLMVNEAQVRKYINDGLLKAHKLGADADNKTSRRWRVWAADLVEFINRNNNTK